MSALKRIYHVWLAEFHHAMAKRRMRDAGWHIDAAKGHEIALNALRCARG
ncbi:hypothetical protein [Rhodomicrobium udaipurense]|uniref:Uncharacterized protein n=1 Tax=Rhodomicrobium udaipurense TaxID=1202716 RepID=A0A8I1GCD3_9HYPH|nr:hypothetical protein [Rhodomicrobium udaipurense]MBJ7543240.1 hypothetical protein [Rhodomicrobium udaipurense]